MTLPFETALDRLRDNFLTRHFTRHDRLEVLLDTIRHGQDAKAAAAEAEAMLHKIGGTAGSVGLAELGIAASLTENFIRLQLAAPALDARAMAEALDAFLDVSLQVCNPTSWPSTGEIEVPAAPTAA